MADIQGKNPTSRTPGREGTGQGNYNFRCSDIHSTCDWQTWANSEDELMRNVERHGREQHDMAEFDENTRNQVRSHINRRAA